jgi:5'-deoxynucleotidase YfbR-like HD superfamily hydrolase
MFNFDVNPHRTLVMLIIHDIPELIHGDIPGFKKTTDPVAHAEHKKRESFAARDFFSSAPAPVNDYFISLYEEFEKKETNESKVAHVIEKLESQLQHLESGPEYWSNEEKGDHMLHYPDNVVNALDNSDMRNLWKIIHDELYSLTYPEEKSENKMP